MGYYTEKALAVKAEQEAKIKELEDALNVLGVQTEEPNLEEVSPDA